MTGSETVLDAIHSAGCNHVFLFVGAMVDPFLAPLASEWGTRAVLATNEAGAAYAADGYARASGNFGVALMIGGPGIFNATGPIGAASCDGVPVLVLTGEAAVDNFGRGYFQDASPLGTDDLRTFDALTGFSHYVPNPESLPQFLRDALRAMLSDWRRPVHLALPVDVQKATIPHWHREWLPAAKKSRTLDRDALQSAVGEALAGVEKVAILAGWGCWESGAAAELCEMAELFGIPVASTYRAKGILPENHPLSLGMFGYAGNPSAIDCISSPDLECLIVLGSSLNQRDTMGWSPSLNTGRKIIQINARQSTLGRNFPVDYPVQGDIRTALRTLLDLKEGPLANLQMTRDARLNWASEFLTAPRFLSPECRLADTSPMHPARVITELRKALPDSAALLVDSGAHRAFAGHYFPVNMPGRFFSATGTGPMGWAIAASLGVACALPGERVAVVTGDGCMFQNGMEIASAARHNLNILFLVINNAALGNVYLRAKQAGPGPAAFTLLRENDWAAFAASLGVRGRVARTSSEISAALNEFMTSEGPMLIDARCDRDVGTPVAPWVSSIQHGNIFSE